VASPPPTAFVLCGALGREVIAIAKRHAWPVTPFGVNAQHHMAPMRIAPAVEERLYEVIPRFERVVVVYGDCGTSGALDEVLIRYNVPRIAGPHCYEMYGGAQFEALMAEEPGTFFLTDFLVRAYHGTIVRGLGLDRFPELKDVYFANYKRVVYLAQRPDDALLDRAHTIARSLQLPLEVRTTGYNMLEARLEALMADIHKEEYRPLPVRAKDDHDGNLSNPLLARHTTPGARTRRRRTR
jgi:hypothetical protein